VVHCVAIINPDTCQRQPDGARLVNAESVREAAALAGNGRLVYVSSDYVFDGRQGGYREQDSPGPVNVYGETKLLGEEHAREARQWLIARLALFGAGLPGLPPTRTEEQLAALRRGEEVVVACDQIGTPLWANTAAALLLELSERGTAGAVHVAGPEAVSKEALLRRLALVTGVPSARIRGVPTTELRPLAPRPLNVGLRASAAVAGLSQYPTTLEAELSRYAGGFGRPD
jgi:dTDP-4-dehydrorhamnose reductase